MTAGLADACACSGTIVFGVTSAAAKGYPKVIFFILGLLYGSNTFFQ